MKKVTSFRGYDGPGWPNQKWLEPFFLTSAGRREVFGVRNNGWGLRARGVDGTEDLPFDKEINITLHIIGKPDLGVLLVYDRMSATDGYSYYSVGDPKMFRTLVKATQVSRMPLGLFIPFEQALKAVVEFIQTNGARPKCIEWIAPSELPEGSFPEPEVTLRD
jgi:immunity protein Imm1 of predicted polymorphic toxin system